MTKRDDILAAALELFAEKGYYGTTVPDVAARAGCGPGTIYRNFESKERLANELYRHVKHVVAQELLQVMVPGEMDGDRFLALWTQLARFAQANPDHIAYVELHHHAPYLDEANRRTEEGLHQLTRAYMLQAMDNGSLRAGDPDMTWALVRGAFGGMFKVAHEREIELTEERIAYVGRTVWNAIKA